MNVEQAQIMTNQKKEIYPSVFSLLNIDIEFKDSHIQPAAIPGSIMPRAMNQVQKA